MADVIFVNISAKHFIDQAIGNGGRVLVHCNGKLFDKMFQICERRIFHGRTA